MSEYMSGKNPGGIHIEKATEKVLKEKGVSRWSPWSCNPSEFDWEYDTDEWAYIKKGRVIVRCPDGEVEIKAGDLVKFPKGLKCRWVVKERIEKVYHFE